MLRFHTYPRRLHIRIAVSECESAAGATASRTFEAFEIRRQLSWPHVSLGLFDSDWSITFGSDLLLADRLPSYRVNNEKDLIDEKQFATQFSSRLRTGVRWINDDQVSWFSRPI